MIIISLFSGASSRDDRDHQRQHDHENRDHGRVRDHHDRDVLIRTIII